MERNNVLYNKNFDLYNYYKSGSLTYSDGNWFPVFMSSTTKLLSKSKFSSSSLSSMKWSATASVLELFPGAGGIGVP